MNKFAESIDSEGSFKSLLCTNLVSIIDRIEIKRLLQKANKQGQQNARVVPKVRDKDRI